ncbi:N-acetylmuramoyl-L-alanine amidase [Rhizobium sp. RCAM05350]|nr:N-acetylmuramoyl-L-alanine amidase [Rhizobium sp. RCAM05350]
MTVRKRTTLGVVHVTATPPGWDKGAAGIRAIHKAKGWSDIGYNEIINPDGRAEMGRGKMAVGAHVAGFNSIAYGLSMVGGVNVSNRPDFNTIKDAELATLERRMRALTLDFPDIEWCSHRDLSPDKNGNGIIEAIRAHQGLPVLRCHSVGARTRPAGRRHQGHMEDNRSRTEQRPGARRAGYAHGLPTATSNAWRLCSRSHRRHRWQENPCCHQRIPTGVRIA